ncbi:transcriptional repressor [Streptomyces sp. RS10V-4]|uniref:Fur family transcriptional regulator n=1 Tax=Streptomyces rhizoryzae TaxID=2932493 RepID=UPI002003DF9C|nr:Fur family transcriptional regulator [Streptomyces rhizoryzae]MCK7628050.1 transcriptional repressor [Streptomyces rhizoryzae]
MPRNRPYAGLPAREVALIGRLTQQRANVLKALMAVEGFVGAQALHSRMADDGSPVGLTTVYRTLNAFADAGRADVVRDDNGERLFRYRPGPDHRHYLVCTACGLSMPVDSGPVEDWVEKTARTSGFANVRHTVELAGLCPDCTQEQAPAR